MWVLFFGGVGLDVYSVGKCWLQEYWQYEQLCLSVFVALARLTVHLNAVFRDDEWAQASVVIAGLHRRDNVRP
jgi:hypothetical protein